MKKVGVCVTQVMEKLKMTQSTASQYLSILQRADLITVERIGKYTYFKRNEETLREMGAFFKNEI